MLKKDSTKVVVKYYAISKKYPNLISELDSKRALANAKNEKYTFWWAELEGVMHYDCIKDEFEVVKQTITTNISYERIEKDKLPSVPFKSMIKYKE